MPNYKEKYRIFVYGIVNFAQNIAKSYKKNVKHIYFYIYL